SAETPPGYYGPAGAPRALNLLTPKSLLKPLPAAPLGVEHRVYEGDTAQPLKPQLLSFALLLLFVDIMAVLLLELGVRGVRLKRPGGWTGLLLLMATALAASSSLDAAHAQSTAPQGRARGEDVRAVQATGKVSFGYVLSGDAAADEISRQGLI